MPRHEYGPGYAASQVAHHEWRTAENSAAHLIHHLQAMARTNPNVKLLDVGAGSGTITVSLAKYIPDGHVTATDISDEILSRARAHSEAVLAGAAAAAAGRRNNMSFQKADVYSLPFEDGAFDVTHAHQVLCHLSRPVDAVREMLRVTRTGGVVALKESDMQTWLMWPEKPGLLKFHDMNTRVLVANGGDDKAGRKLLSLVLAAGARRESIDVGFGAWCYSSLSDRQTWGK